MPSLSNSSVCCDCYNVTVEDPLQELIYLRYSFFCVRQRPTTIVLAFSGLAAYIWLLVKFVIYVKNVEQLDFGNTTHWRIVYYPVQILLMAVLLITTFRKSATLLAAILWLQLIILQVVLVCIIYWFVVIPNFALPVFIYYLASMYLWLCVSSYYQELRGSHYLHMAPKVVKT